MNDLLDQVALQKITEISRDLIIITDGQGIVQYANDLFYQRLEYDRDDVAAGKICAHQFYLGGREEALRVTRDLRTNGVIENYRTELFKADRRYRIDVNLTLVGFPPKGDSLDWIVGINKDVFEIERLLTEIGRLNEDRELQEFVRDLENPMMSLTDSEGQIFYCNEATTNALGYSTEELVNRKNVGDLYWGGIDEARRVFRLLVNSIEDDSEELKWQNTSLKRRDGSELKVRIALRLYFSGRKRSRQKISSILGINQPKNNVKKTGFLSYSSEDQPRIMILQDALKELGIHAWTYKQHGGPGENIEKEISEAIEKGDYFFLCMTPAAIASAACHREIGTANYLANKGQVKFIPILLEGSEVPAGIAHLRYVNFVGDLATGFLELLSLIKPIPRSANVVSALKKLVNSDFQR